jgi:hypothetical protein
MRSSAALCDYFKNMEKTDCPVGCRLKVKKGIKPVCVPPPEDILGVIISRDPTTDWLYQNLNKEPENYRRKILFASAIPLSLLTKISIFLREGIVEDGLEYQYNNDIERLYGVIFEKTYWTHLHKCPTDIKEKVSLKFEKMNATICADTWLEQELGFAIGNSTKFIISLGNEVKRWVDNWKREGKSRNRAHSFTPSIGAK